VCYPSLAKSRPGWLRNDTQPASPTIISAVQRLPRDVAELWMVFEVIGSSLTMVTGCPRGILATSPQAVHLV
jgi:hypothetical protein